AADGTVLRALSPLYGVETGALPAGVMDDYIDRVWQKYTTSTLTVTPFADRPAVRYSGRVSGGVMRFTDTSGAVVTSFDKPDASSAFCSHRRQAARIYPRSGANTRPPCLGAQRAPLVV